MTPAMVATARELAKVWTGPPLVQHVVSEGYPSYQCGDCGAVVSEEEAEDENCPHCGAGDFPDDWVPEMAYPDRDTVPDLSSGRGGIANIGPLYMALDNATPKAVHFYSLADGYEVSWHNESIEGQDYVAEALALAFLAASR